MAKNNAEFGKKYTFYRPDYVINFQAVVSLKGFSTVNIEIAPCINKAAQWDQKITLQLSEQDLYKYEGKVFYFKCSVGEWFYGQLLMLEQLLGHPLSLTEARSIILETKSPKAVQAS